MQFVMANIYDNRSVVGRYLRGRTIYGGHSMSPNPVGLNQHKFNPKKAALLRKKKLLKKKVGPFK